MESAALDLNELNQYLDQVKHRGRTILLPTLHKAQNLYGWIPREAQIAISNALRTPLAEIHGVIEFYTMFYNRPTTRRVVRVCEDTACYLAGGEEVIHSLEQTLQGQHGGNARQEKISFEAVPCLGMCEHAPAGLNGTRPAGGLSEETLNEFLSGFTPEPSAQVYGEPRLITRLIGRVDPSSLASYEKAGGYQGLRKALELGAEGVIEIFADSEILGRGGAMFPLGQKQKFTRGALVSPQEKHIVVNADESEPGTFKDRCLLEEDPFAVIEAATIAGFAVGATNGWIFVRGEYPRSYRRLETAIRQAKEEGYLGKNILGVEGFDFDIELRLGAGAYICGEETALFEAIEGRRGFPRIKPPFPTTHGLFGQPTAVNNVETMVAALRVLETGVESWKALGSQDSPGTKLFCLSGHVAKPGLYELPFGMTIQEVINLAGGVPAGRKLQAVLMGGAAGVFIGPDQLDMPLTYDEARARDIPLGSGVIMVFDDTVDLREPVYQISRFFAHESCGKCFPCQLGTQRQMEILDHFRASATSVNGEKEALLDIGFAMTETSLCGLGQTAASAVMSAIKLWPEMFE